MRREERRRAAPPSPLLVGEMSDGETGAEPARGAGVTGIWVVTALYGARVVTGSSNVGIAGGDEPGTKTGGLRTVTGSMSGAAWAAGGFDPLGAGDDGLEAPIAAGAGVGPRTFGGDDGDNLVLGPAPGP